MYLGQRLLEYDFLQIARGKTITSSFQHSVSDTFILIISERAHLEMTYISMSPKVIIARRTAKEQSNRAGMGLPGQGKFCILSRKKLFLMHIFWAKITRI